jgi:hypothetical protein
MYLVRDFMRLFIIISLTMFSFSSFSFTKEEISAAKKKMIQQSINSYSGSCPCPYNTTKRGHRCGKRSAYSKPGGASPLCYERDIAEESASKVLLNNR